MIECFFNCDCVGEFREEVWKRRPTEICHNLKRIGNRPYFSKIDLSFTITKLNIFMFGNLIKAGVKEFFTTFHLSSFS